MSQFILKNCAYCCVDAAAVPDRMQCAAGPVGAPERGAAGWPHGGGLPQLSILWTHPPRDPQRKPFSELGTRITIRVNAAERHWRGTCWQKNDAWPALAVFNFAEDLPFIRLVKCSHGEVFTRMISICVDYKNNNLNKPVLRSWDYFFRLRLSFLI